MPELVGYLLLFVATGVGFIWIHLMVGKLIRPARPDAEKMTIYECGEPTIGSAWVQFDVRFYVVALLFVIFDVEMAFFFPWAVVFGKANALAKVDLPPAERIRLTDALVPHEAWLLPGQLVAANQTPSLQRDFRASVEAHNGPLRTPSQRENGVPPNVEKAVPNAKAATLAERTRDAAENFGWVAFVDILVFFGVLLVGFAYLWRRGDLNWVRSTAAQHEPPPADTEESGRAPLATVV